MLQSRDQETNRRLKNVLITIFWLGRRAQSDRFYDGPYLNFKAFEGLLGTALYKALQESSSQKGNNTRDSGFGESWYSEREELHQLRGEEDEEGGGGGGGGHRRDDSLDSLDSLDSRPLSISSDTTLKGSSEGCCSDTEVDSVFKMSENRDGISYRRSASITPKATTPFNQFLPTKDKQSGYVPAPLRKKRAERNDDNRRSWANPTYSEEEGPLTSYKKSGSSSDESDCDISPWLSSAPSPSGTSPSHTHTHEASAHTTTLVVGKSPHTQAHSPPQLPKIQPPLLLTPPLVFPPVDPASGPRLVKCERWPLLGRQDPREPLDPFDYESIIPDLENDDMFARRTLAFQSNTDLAMMKTKLTARRPLYTSEPQLNIVTQRHADASTEESEFPDIEQDDVVYRKEKTQQEQRPLSGAPDNYAPMPVPEPWALPPDLKARLLCPPCPLTKEAGGSKQVENETRPKTDDMLVRKFGVGSDKNSLRGSSANQMTPSVPSSRSEGDLQKWQAIREASQLRYKKKLLVERLAALKS